MLPALVPTDELRWALSARGEAILDLIREVHQTSGKDIADWARPAAHDMFEASNHVANMLVEAQDEWARYQSQGGSLR